jgi:hypothetical protein
MSNEFFATIMTTIVVTGACIVYGAFILIATQADIAENCERYGAFYVNDDRYECRPATFNQPQGETP